MIVKALRRFVCSSECNCTRVLKLELGQWSGQASNLNVLFVRRWQPGQLSPPILTLMYFNVQNIQRKSLPVTLLFLDSVYY